MKKLIVLLLALSVTAFAANAKKQTVPDDNAKTKHHAEKMTTHKGHAMISVPTIQCDNCVKTVESALKKLDGVDSVKVDLDKKMAHVNFNPEKLKQEDIEKAIAAAGYDANDVKRDEKAHANLLPCCQSKRKESRDK